MEFHATLAILFIALLVQACRCQQGNPDSDPYVPVYTECPENLTVRNASDVCPSLDLPSQS